MTIRRAAITLLLLAAGLWGAVCVMLYMKRAELIYPFHGGQDAGSAAGIIGISARTIEATDGTPLVVWTAPRRRTRAVILHFIGNAGAPARTIALVMRNSRSHS